MALIAKLVGRDRPYNLDTSSTIIGFVGLQDEWFQRYGLKNWVPFNKWLYWCITVYFKLFFGEWSCQFPRWVSENHIDENLPSVQFGVYALSEQAIIWAAFEQIPHHELIRYNIEILSTPMTHHSR